MSGSRISIYHITKFDDSKPVEADGLSGKKEALVDDLYIHFISETSTCISSLQSEGYDSSYNIPYDNYEQLEQDPTIETLLVPSANALFKFNLAEGISSNHELREIINMALNVDDIMMAVFPNKDFYWLDSGYMHEDIVGWASEARSNLHNQNDIEKANNMLVELDYAGEEF